MCSQRFWWHLPGPCLPYRVLHRSSSTTGDTLGQGDPSDFSSSPSWVTMWWQTRPRRRSQPAPSAGSSWCHHGNRAQRRTGPAFSLCLFGKASSATLKPIHRGEPGPCPCPPPPLVLLGQLFLPQLFLPSSSPAPFPSHPPLCSLCQSAGRGKLGQGRTQIFNSKQISPPQAASPFMHFSPYYHKRRNLHQGE